MNLWFELAESETSKSRSPSFVSRSSSFVRGGKLSTIGVNPACRTKAVWRSLQARARALDHGEHAALGHGFHGFIEQLDPLPLFTRVVAEAAIQFHGQFNAAVAEVVADNGHGDAASEASAGEEVAEGMEGYFALEPRFLDRLGEVPGALALGVVLDADVGAAACVWENFGLS